MKAEMSETSEHGFRPVESCVDYRSYVYTIDAGLSRQRYMASRRKLIAIGTTNEERMGVVYVRGPWGFFVIPHYGYPTLRVSFFHDTPAAETDNILEMICAAFDLSDAIIDQGDFNE